MTPAELASRIQLSPRAIVMTGTLSERTKTSEGGTISCFTPHHAKQGSPAVCFDGDEPAPVHMDGACIECALNEVSPLTTAARSYGRVLNLVHMIFGAAGVVPTQNELKCLREAGQIFRANLAKPIHFVALPILVSGQYGVAQGRLYVLGLFDKEGNTLFVNPAAKEANLLQADYPEAQKIRTLVDAPLQVAAAPEPEPLGLPAWYSAAADTLAVALKLKGTKLHEAVLNTRASIVAKEQKLTPKAALAAVTAEYDQAKAALKAPAAAPKSIPVPAAPAQAPAKSLLKARV